MVRLAAVFPGMWLVTCGLKTFPVGPIVRLWFKLLINHFDNLFPTRRLTTKKNQRILPNTKSISEYLVNHLTCFTSISTPPTPPAPQLATIKVKKIESDMNR